MLYCFFIFKTRPATPVRTTKAQCPPDGIDGVLIVFSSILARPRFILHVYIFTRWWTHFPVFNFPSIFTSQKNGVSKIEMKNFHFYLIKTTSKFMFKQRLSLVSTKNSEQTCSFTLFFLNGVSKIQIRRVEIDNIVCEMNVLSGHASIQTAVYFIFNYDSGSISERNVVNDFFHHQTLWIATVKKSLS